MADVNNCTFTGNLGADAEVRTSQSGNEWVKLRLANNIGWGEWEHCNWLNVRVSGREGATKFAKGLKKGDRIFVVGELKISAYDKDDQRKYFTEVSCGFSGAIGYLSSGRVAKEGADEEAPF